MESLHLDVWMLLILGGFLAAFIDSVVGGGGLIAVPVLLMAGLPPHLALGTNKLGGTLSSLTSVLSFMYSGKIDWKLSRRLIPYSIIGAALGTFALQAVPSAFLKPVIVVLLLAVTIYTFMRKSWGDRSTYKELTRKTAFFMLLSALIMGGYDGFFGPGTGSLLIFIFLILGFDFVVAAGNAKVLNFSSNIASLLTFIILGSVNYQFGLIMGASMIVGSLVGSQVAIRQGARYVRPLFITVSILLVGKQVWDILALS